MRKKSYAILLATAMALGTSAITGQAAVPTTVNESHFGEIMPAYEIAGAINSSFLISNNTAKLLLSVSSPVSKKVSITMVLQIKNGSSWDRVKKWTKEGVGTQTLSKSKEVINGRTYRMKYTVTVGSETVTGKTPAKTA